MFNMKDATGKDKGYQLRITYLAAIGEYRLVGYIGFGASNGRVNWKNDGGRLTFKSLEELLQHITTVGE